MASKSAIQILVPMGGLGSRFAKLGNPTPKPLIEVDGKPMILKAVSSFRNLSQHANVELQMIFVVRTEHDQQFGLVAKLAEACPGSKFAMLDHDTRGAVESCLIARALIDPNLPIVVMDCDLHFQSKAYDEALLSLVTTGYAGLLLTFQSKAPRYSFALHDEHGEVSKTAEKVPISNSAIIGAYAFGSGAIFLEAADQLMQRNVSEDMKEYYLSLLYNIILAKGLKVKAVQTELYESFGTPEELALYQKGERSFMTE